ncbi:MAG TPA: polyphosphate polymerase domain-containing protein [Anaerolineae bacterium]|nr:polyphosphate polymerase domain-containing protein [Anaerolineae bacterium]
MSTLSHTIRKFDRFELKYLVPIVAAEKFRQALRAYLVPDDHGNAHGCYHLSSLYYDGPGYYFYWEKIDGIKFRRKLRIRHYDSGTRLTGDTPVFCEIKQRLNKVTQKRRVLLPYAQARQLCDERRAPGEAPDRTVYDRAVIGEIEAMLWQYNLRRASVVSYTRRALVGSDYDIGLRVTFDTDLTCRTDQLEISHSGSGLPLLPPGWTIVEIKVNERMPYWLTELVGRHNLSLVRVSKYCRSIELAQSLPAPAWRPAAAWTMPGVESDR